MEITSPRAQLALDTILRKPVMGIPGWQIHTLEHRHIERLAGAPPGEYRRNPEATYLAFLRSCPICLLDQYIPHNPLEMGDQGYEGDRERGATTGAEQIVCDGMAIDSPEAVVEHMQRFAFPALQQAAAAFDEDARAAQILREEAAIQEKLGPDILKSGHGFVWFPGFSYGAYGYADYFMACALYPEVIERHFALQAELALLNNRAAARAYQEGNLPPLFRLDHDMADSRGTLTKIAWLDKHWLPHFARCLEPMLKSDVTMIWHCDGNLTEMVPRLLEVGIRGFQGFQYEDGMDYERICKMRTKAGEEPLIIAGVSVTRTLPRGAPEDVKREMRWLVDNGPKSGLFLGGSSSITPGVPWENLRTFIEGLEHYRTHGR